MGWLTSAYASPALACSNSPYSCGQPESESKPCSASGAGCTCNYWSNSNCKTPTNPGDATWKVGGSSGCPFGSGGGGSATMNCTPP